MNRNILSVLAAFLLIQKGYCQPYTLGDTIPKTTLTNIWNIPDSVIELGGKNEKLTILDFWGFTCLTCLQSFPKIEALQKQFSKNVRIILVNTESFDRTAALFKKRPQLTLPATPFVTTDSLLNSWFPHQGNPFHVWIDKNGVVVNIGNSATKERLSGYFKSNSVESTPPVKTEYTETLFSDKYAPSIQFGSYLSRCIDGTRLSASRMTSQSVRLTQSCSTIPELFIFAFNGYGIDVFGRPGRVSFVDLDVTGKFMRPLDDPMYRSWVLQNTFNYQLIVPKGFQIDPYDRMKNDLEDYFGIDAVIETRLVHCLTLIRTSGTDKIKTTGAKPFNSFYKIGQGNDRADSVRAVINKPFSVFVRLFSTYIENSLNFPFVDSTGYNGNIDISFEGLAVDKVDLNAIRQTLQKHDFDLVERYCRIAVLVLKNKHGQK